MSADDAPELRNVPDPSEGVGGYGGIDRVATIAQEFMAQIEQGYGEGAEVGVVAIVADLRTQAQDSEGNVYPMTVLTWRSNEPRRWIQSGIFQSCAERIKRVFG